MTKHTNNKDSDDALAIFLANGGVVQQIARDVSSQLEGQTFWGTAKKAAKVAASPAIKKSKTTKKK